MGKNRLPLILLGLAVLVFGSRYIMKIANKQSDQQMIKEAVAEAIQASKEGRPGGVVDKLTESFKIDEMQPGMRQVAKIVKESHPDVTIADATPTINGDTADMTSKVSVHATFMGQTIDKSMDGVKLVFKKETVRDWLVFSDEKWHLAEVHLPDGVNPFLPQ